MGREGSWGGKHCGLTGGGGVELEAADPDWSLNSSQAVKDLKHHKHLCRKQARPMMITHKAVLPYKIKSYADSYMTRENDNVLVPAGPSLGELI